MTDDPLLNRLVQSLADVPGIAAIVLGGSRAIDTATADSDYDIGLYIEPHAPLDVAVLRSVASALDDRCLASLVTERGAWGPWIDGGGWLQVDGQQVDLLYRDLGKVRDVITEAREGRFSTHYQPGHPHAFLSTIYMGEVALCWPLLDSAGTVAGLKAEATPFPKLLRESLVSFFSWEAGFSLDNGRKTQKRADPGYAAGCAFRAVAAMTQVLFALNGVYCINEKGAVARASRLPTVPDRFEGRVADVFARIGANDTVGGFDVLASMIEEVRALAGTSR